jgi:hypothetical protein
MDLLRIPLAAAADLACVALAAVVAAVALLAVDDGHANHTVADALLVLPLRSKTRSLWELP